jgi:hypothetical protein
VRGPLLGGSSTLVLARGCEVVDGTQWAQAGTSLARWMLLPLMIGIWRIPRQEVAA